MPNSPNFLKESLFHLRENAIWKGDLVLSPVRAPAGGDLREQLDVPVSPAENADETALYEDPRDASVKYYLPCYRTATEQTAGGREWYRIALEERTPGWALRVHLAKRPAQQIEQAARDAKELPHEASVILRYSLAGTGGVQKELTFADLTSEEGGVRAELQLSGMAERDEVYVALTEPESGAELIVRRTFTVAVPVPPLRPQPVGPLHDLPLFPKAPGQGTGAWKPLIISAPDVSVRKPLVRARAITAISGQPSQRLASAIGSRALKLRQPITVAPQPRYRKLLRMLDNRIPFVFPPHLHDYIFGGITPSSDRPGLIRHQLSWGGAFHSYYQESSRKHLFYYLPDAFKLARQPDSPFLPFMSVRFASEDGSLEASEATLAYAAAPFVDPGRLKAAALHFQSLMTETPSAGVAVPVFQPLLADADRLSFRLALPGAADGLFQPRPGASVNLKLGIVDSLSLSMPELQSVFDALMGTGAAVLMNGEVEVKLLDQNVQIAEKIPFVARMNDLAGDLFECRHESDPASGVIRVRLRNAIESPLRIERLSAGLLIDGTETKGAIRDVALPVGRLAPGEELTFALVPERMPAEGTAAELLVDRDGIAVVPDPEAIWNAIQVAYTAQYQRVITVKTLAAIFQSPPEQPEEERLGVIVVELKQGDGAGVTVELKPDALEAQVPLKFPIGDVVLGRPDGGEFAYRVMAVRLGGATQTEWKTKSGSLLFILKEDVT